MGRIQVLDEQLTNMIAAGEVVERPASVVKELVENAIDAGASSIQIHIEEGGLSLIRVVDDGMGMDREDCVRAFERHATSKIRSTRDLFHIRTLGFRGEALPSIASVSRMELISNTSSSLVGTRVTLEGGAIGAVEDAAATKGTDVRVRDLFYNTPARLKYMKSISTEVGHISDYVNRLAITSPGIAFRLTHNGKTLLQTTGDGKLLHVLAAIYGMQTAKRMIPISGETIDFRWHGFLSGIDVTRANRSYLTTLVNGRYVRSFPLANAILKGYHTLLPGGRYPIAVLHVEMDPVLVDVNVHPAKLEVRFSKEQELCAAIEASVRQHLIRGQEVVRPFAGERKPKQAVKPVQPQFDLRLPEAGRNPSVTSKQAAEDVLSKRTIRLLYAPEPSAPAASTGMARPAEKPAGPGETEPASAAPQKQEAAAPVIREVSPPFDASPPAPQPMEETASTSVTAEPEKSEDAFPEWDAQPENRPSPEAGGVPAMYPVGQVHGTYIVAQNETGMYLIDQHAAQERIFYEHFLARLSQESAASQMLLFPHTVELTQAEAERLKERMSMLLSFGLDVEWFGPRTLIVRAHPHWFPAGCELEVIDELIQQVLEAGSGLPDPAALREKAAIMMSCKAAIKANRFLTHAEMEALLERLRSTTSPFTCPHGRPIVVHFSTYDLEKMFKRVM